MLAVAKITIDYAL